MNCSGAPQSELDLYMPAEASRSQINSPAARLCQGSLCLFQAIGRSLLELYIGVINRGYIGLILG